MIHSLFATKTSLHKGLDFDHGNTNEPIHPVYPQSELPYTRNFPRCSKIFNPCAQHPYTRSPEPSTTRQLTPNPRRRPGLKAKAASSGSFDLDCLESFAFFASASLAKYLQQADAWPFVNALQHQASVCYAAIQRCYSGSLWFTRVSTHDGLLGFTSGRHSTVCPFRSKRSGHPPSSCCSVTFAAKRGFLLLPYELYYRFSVCPMGPFHYQEHD